ncbi:MAG: flagellar hook-basal body complex protein [Rhodospirillaceae bacterium]|nr:flagellar hook-basal body complex protein [Rhodospirillaceae bacterium]
MAIGLFQPAVLGMKSQAHALDTIGINVANVNTGGYKRTDTRFETLISKTLSQQSDLGGVKPKDYQRIGNQGFINASDRDLDLAINGDGFFYVSPTFTVSDEIFFTRDGSFEMGLADAQTSTVTADDGSSITINNGYLVDKNGYYVLGTAADATTGLFTATSTLAPVRIDEWAFVGQSTPTTTADLSLNLPTTSAIVADHAGTVATALGGTNSSDLHVYSIEVVDSAGAKRSSQLNFTKSADNTWQVSATTDRNSSPQADTIIFGGTAEAGDVYNVTVTLGGVPTTVSYTSLGTEGSLAGIRTAVVAAINANATIAASVTASAGNANGEITLTANAAATSFTSSTSVSDGTTAQVDTVTLAGAPELNDQYLVSVDGTTFTYTSTGAEGTIDVIRDNLLALINANAPTVASVIATASGSNDIRLEARSAGTPFTTTATSTAAGGAVPVNSATLALTTANVTGTNDNTAVRVSSTSFQTTSPQTLSFGGDGLPTGSPPTPLTMALTFADGATSNFSLDIADMTQFGTGFVPFSYSHNGEASASMTSVQFDDAGHVLGSFTDGTERFVYKIPVGIFQNPGQLEMLNGMVFRETPDSGSAVSTFADVSDRADFIPFAFETSNVDLATEFTHMIKVQKAYNSSATVFRTVDEMLITGRDLKA